MKSVIETLRKVYLQIGFEAMVWMFGLFYLNFIHNPGNTHFTICPFANFGFEFCPGCGLGNSISYIFMGNFIESFHSHPLGIFALIIIALRIITIINNNRRKYA